MLILLGSPGGQEVMYGSTFFLRDLGNECPPTSSDICTSNSHHSSSFSYLNPVEKGNGKDPMMAHLINRI